jgi:hypothetical protein
MARFNVVMACLYLWQFYPFLAYTGSEAGVLGISDSARCAKPARDLNFLPFFRSIGEHLAFQLLNVPL